jgi:parallel beta-helix repeat protein
VTFGKLSFSAAAVSLFFLSLTAHATTYLVDGSNPKANDKNDGSALTPFATIARGVKSLVPGDVVLIKAGTYRESASMEANGTAQQPITIAAAPGDEGKVIITGSDLIKDWKKLSPVVYTIPWTLAMDCHYPDSWIQKTAVGDYGPYSKRCEMVFINGQSIQEVLATGLMRRGTFTIDETRHQLRLALADPSVPFTQAEVSVRQDGLKFHGNHLIIRGLTVTHVANGYFNAALSVRGDDNVIENCRSEWNNLDGMYMSGNRILVTGDVSNHNGQTGMSLSIQDSRIEGNETDDNSWRYGPGWAEGGIKCIGGVPAGNQFIRDIAKNNMGAGIWLDTCGANNRVERCWLENNEIAGLEFEACLGANFAANNVIFKTRGIPNALYPEADGAGIMLYESGDVTLVNNTLVDNEHAGIIFAGAARGNGGTCANETVMNNIIANNGLAGISFWVRGPATKPAALASYHCDYNLWWQPRGTFGNPPSGKVSGLGEWRKAFNQDAHSIEADPKFVAPGKADYHLQPSSPAIGKGTNLGDVNEYFDGHPRDTHGGATIGAMSVR